jgi:hypothetical protein
MTTLEGFLGQAPGEPPRMTPGQRDLVLRGARAALEAAYPKAAATGILLALQGAMDASEASRACQCCDYFASGFCVSWDDDVPKHVRPDGCDRWKDDGAPF